jgi:hypothetical protein
MDSTTPVSFAGVDSTAGREHSGSGQGEPMKKLFVTLGLLLIPSLACGQTAYRKDGIAIGPTGQALAGVSIAVCTQPTDTETTPCSPSATLYPDSNGVIYTISTISCLADVVTVDTTASNDIPIGQWVTIANVLDPSFDGTFQVTGQSGSGGFQYQQACTNGSSSGGDVWGANPTFSDGLGNYFYYAQIGTYTVQVYGNQISTQVVLPDQSNVVNTRP